MVPSLVRLVCDSIVAVRASGLTVVSGRLGVPSGRCRALLMQRSCGVAVTGDVAERREYGTCWL